MQTLECPSQQSMSRRAFTRILSSLPLAWRTRLALSEPNSNVLMVPPGFSAKWDVQPQGSELATEFWVMEYRFYDILMLFHSTLKPFTVDDLKELYKFTGDGSMKAVTKDSADSDNPSVVPTKTVEDVRSRDEGISTGRHVWIPAQPGVTIPVHLRVEGSSTVAANAVIVDQDFQTRDIQGSFPGFSRSSPGGLARPITSVKLRPGNYQLHARTLGPTSLPANVETYLTVTYRPNTRRLKDRDK
jgi:hypothetical protein